MAELSKIKLPSGTSYDLKDTTARQSIEDIKKAISGGIHYIGVTTTELTDGATTNPIIISGESIAVKSGDLVFYGKQEFIFADTDNTWHQLGDGGATGLGTLAYKDNVSADYTPTGTISNIITASTSTVNTKYTPEGDVSISSSTTGTVNYTPSGSVSTPTITVTPATTTKYVAESSNGGGSVTTGKAASCTFPEFSTSVADETLTFSWTGGTFTTNTPTTVTLPSFSQQTIATGITSASSSQPSFTGTGAVLTAGFTGTEGTTTGSITPNISVSSTFVGDKATIKSE